MRSISRLSLTAFLSLVLSLIAVSAAQSEDKAPAKNTPADKTAPAPAGGDEPAADAKCDHGVKKAICTRCNPKLKPVFQAKNDWCAEHDRPESQCAICHPDLAKKGIKK